MSRFLLIGFDGAEPSLAERWMDEGLLPNLSRLREFGAYLPLESTIPPATFPAWTTCVTGVNPGRHGIVDFTQVVPGRYALRFLNARDRKAPALWTILGAEGKRCAVIGVPATYPPELVNGIMVSGFDSPVCTAVDKSFVYPPELYEKVKEWRFADFQESDIGPGWHEQALPKLFHGIKVKEKIASNLLQREPWDFFMVVFGESDTVSHHFWMFHDPNSPRHMAGFENAIRAVYIRLDAALGRLIEAAGPDVTVAVVSDHGFGGAGDSVIHLNNWLAEQGFLSFAPSSSGSLLKQFAMKFIPEHLRGALFRKLQTLAAGAESKSRFGGIDWNNTRAWSEELNYFPSIRINLEGREPNGQVPERVYNDFCRKLCQKLETWPPVKRAWRRDEVFQGPYVDRAPDILLELALKDGYSYSCLRSRGGASLRQITPQERLGGKEHGMNGNHRQTGVLFLSVPTSVGAANIQDVAPTVLATLGVPTPPMDGTSLLAPAQEGASIENPVIDSPYNPEQELAIEERLRALGYLE
jgi:predicted AlkP superfamily phosphohydrolase/phosphomutase